MRIAAAAVVCSLAALAGVNSRALAEEKPPADASRLDLDAIITRLDDLFRSKSSIARVELTVTKPRQRRPRVLTMRMWSLGQEKALIVIESPARERGVATLKVGNNLWNYLPRISRTIRIPASLMLGSWMGSDFTNDDLVKESSFRDDFDPQLVGRSADPAGWLVSLRAKPGVVGLWKHIEWVVNDTATLPVEARYFDRKGRLSRVMTFDEVRKFGERKIPAHMVLVPMDRDGQPKKGRRTEMRYLDMQFDAKVPDSKFSLSELERSR